MRSASRILLSEWDEGAVTAMARGLLEETGGAALAVVFVSADWRGQLGELIEILQIAVSYTHLTLPTTPYV